MVRSFSIDPQTEERLNARFAELRPRVKGLSHYVQLLIELDLSRKAGAPDGDPTLREWCALQGSNLRPLPCEGNGTTLDGIVVSDMKTAREPLSQMPAGYCVQASVPQPTERVVCFSPIELPAAA